MPDAPVINGMVHSLEIHFQRQPKPLRSAQGPIWGRRWDHHENKSPIFVSNRDVMRLNSRGFPKRPVSPSNRGKQKASADAKVSARAPRRQHPADPPSDGCWCWQVDVDADADRVLTVFLTTLALEPVTMS